MESLSRSSHLLVFAALVVKATSRIPCAAHQNVDGAGCGTNQPNVITQSVTWSATKKGQKPTATVETDGPIDDIMVEASPAKSLKMVSGNPRYARSEYADTEDDLDFKLKRLVRLLDNMQRREDKCDWGCSRPRKCWKKNYWKKREVDFEEDDYPVRETESIVDYSSDEEEDRAVRRSKRPRYQKIYDAEDIEDAEPTKRVKMVPKMDWLVLKKCPKRCPKRWMKDEVERGRDSQEAGSARDVLYIPQSEPREKCRRRIVSDYTR